MEPLPQRHYDQHVDDNTLDLLENYVETQHANELIAVTNANGELTFVVKKDDIVPFLTFLRDDTSCQFTQLMDLCGVDYSQAHSQTLKQEKRFAVVYHLLSLTKNMRVRVRVLLDDGETLPTVTGVFSAANWFERECYDMFGIRFENHPDLRRILCDYEFNGYPLRKDFPLNGHVETYYDKDMERVAYKPVDLPQEFRQFDQQSPWKGMTGNGYLAEESATANVFDKSEFEK